MAPKRKGNDDGDKVEFSKLKVAELKNECMQRGLDTTGKKFDLVQRLNEYEKASGSKCTKIIKKEDDEDEDIESLSMKDKLNKLAQEEKHSKRKTFQVDSNFPYIGGTIVNSFDCMLNQTNIGHNNNKFYIIQLIECAGVYYTWNRWGRVGEVGQNAMKSFAGDLSAAEKDFKKKFKDKTKNNWDARETFTPHTGKYTLIEMDVQNEEDNAAMEMKLDQPDSVHGVLPNDDKNVKPCTLNKPTQALMQLIFNNDMFKEAMAKMNLDVKKMPLGKLSKSQIAKGFEVLEKLDEAIKEKSRSKIETLTSCFYTVIPHSFGRNRPPLIADEETLKLKFDMLSVLGDIEIAQGLQKTVIVKQEEEEVDHPLDVNYQLLKCGLKHVKHDSDTFKMISEYTVNTGGGFRNMKLLDVWEVDRENEDTRFAEHQNILHRKLLWHGTNVAVVVAILKSGLRIMPHSGGRVGSGIYFASEHAKSACYVGFSNDGTGIMFLNEVALGKQHVITSDDHTLKKAPHGFDSVLAKGYQEPNPNDDVKIEIDGNDIIVPKGEPIRYNSLSSSFSQSEYLVYKESQCRIRYLLRFKM